MEIVSRTRVEGDRSVLILSILLKPDYYLGIEIFISKGGRSPIWARSDRTIIET